MYKKGQFIISQLKLRTVNFHVAVVRFLSVSIASDRGVWFSFPSSFSLLPFSRPPHPSPLLCALLCALPFGSVRWILNSRNSGSSAWCIACGCSFGGLTFTTNAGGQLPPAKPSALLRPVKGRGSYSTPTVPIPVRPRTNGFCLVRPACVSPWHVYINAVLLRGAVCAYCDLCTSLRCFGAASCTANPASLATALL